MTEKDRQAIALEQDQQVRRTRVATENLVASNFAQDLTSAGAEQLLGIGPVQAETADIAFWLRPEGVSWQVLNHNGISPDLNSAFNAVKAIYLHSPHS